MPEPAHPRPLDQDLAQRVLRVALEHGGDEAEVFAEYSRSRSISYEEGKVRSCNAAVASGVAVRVLRGEAQGLAFTETGREQDILEAARSASRIANGGKLITPQPLVAVRTPGGRYQTEQEIAAVEAPERIALAAQLHDVAACADDAVSWIQAQLIDGERWIQVAHSDGTWAVDYQPMLRVALSVYLQAGDRRERGYATFGQRAGYEVLSDARLDALAAEAVRLGRLRLDAAPCPAGTMPVVLAAGTSGVLIHEAVGHGLEADFNRRGVSAYSNRLGEQVASPLVTIIDEGERLSGRGSLHIDDEGTPVHSTILIENGVLRGYLTDRLSARLMGLPRTGNGRRESYRSLPVPRMRNTGLAAGSSDPDAIIRSVKKGLYAKTIGGGSVDITKGDYNFEVMEGYLIEDGRITTPVRGATLVGNGPETMRRVVAVGHDIQYDCSAYTCGKDGQGAPVGVFTPTVHIDELVVGGERA